MTMASIGASTMHTVRKAKPKKVVGKPSAKKSSSSKRASVAPRTRPLRYATPEAVTELRDADEETRRAAVAERLRAAFGEREGDLNAPHAASTTADRSRAAADVGVAAATLGVLTVLKRYGVLAEVERVLLPEGLGRVFANADGTTNGGGMRKIASAVSLRSMGSNDGGSTAASTSSRRGGMPPAAREGALLVLRALCETSGRAAEPYVVPLLAAVLDESSSTNGGVRTAAEDAAVAIVNAAAPHAAPRLICPVLFAAVRSSEWRVKVGALERLSQLANVAPAQISASLPQIIPAVTAVVWDTKPQVVAAAKDCLIRTCRTNVNPDVRPAIPAVVNAICKPSDTTKAIDELMATTFVATVDASTLAILCPVLSRGLREKFTAVHKRSCCLVIQNMSRLVETPEAVEPFGPLLVPDLKKVAENVQFDEIRDAALAALRTLTRALGHASVEEAVRTVMADETRRVQEEERRIEEERDEERRREEETRLREEEERRQWKEAMEAQRLLDQIEEKKEEERKTEKARQKEKAKTKVRNDKGVCQGCGLKKCKKACLFAQ